MTLISGDMFYLREGHAGISHSASDKRRRQGRTMRAGALGRLINPVAALGARLSRQPGRKATHADFAALSARTLDDIGVRRSSLTGVVGTIENERHAGPVIGSTRKARTERRRASADRRNAARVRGGRRIQYHMERRTESALGRGARRVIVRVD